MYKLCFVIILLLTLPFYPNYTYAEGVDGYGWQELPTNFKGVIVMSFISGYRAGKLYGNGNAMKSTISFLESYRENGLVIKKNINGFNESISVLKSNPMVFFGSTFAADKNINKNGDYYAREVDSFLMTFPLCRKIEIYVTLSMLAPVWDNSAESYKNVAESCLKSE